MLARKALAEFIGTAVFLAGVVGSGIAAQRLSNDPGLQLLANAAATAGVLVSLILAVGPVSGGHFNPVVAVADRVLGGATSREVAAYLPAQVAGAATGVVAANLMFDLGPITWSTTERSGSHLWLAETIATFGLLLVVFGIVRSGRSHVAPFAVGAYIGAAYWFTSSTSFANPAVTLARTLSDTFAGIQPASAPVFVVAQVIGLGAALVVVRILYPTIADVAGEVIVPHERQEPS